MPSWKLIPDMRARQIDRFLLGFGGNGEVTWIALGNYEWSVSFRFGWGEREVAWGLSFCIMKTCPLFSIVQIWSTQDITKP